MVGDGRDGRAGRAPILDINLGPGQPSGVEAYRWLRAQRFRGRIVFLTGHAMEHPEVLRAHQLADAIVLQKPVRSQQVIAALDGAVLRMP